jgi:hypothetical protein
VAMREYYVSGPDTGSPLRLLDARNAPTRCRNSAESKVWHSHTTKTSQPRAVSFLVTRASRLRFSANLAAQKAARVFGDVLRGQPRCRCQKHPCTRMIFLSRGNTRSGVPGKSRVCSRKRYPRRCAVRRTIISGTEFLALTRPISADRTGSMKSTPTAFFCSRRFGFRGCTGARSS